MIGALARHDVEAFRTVVARELGLRFEDDKLPFLAEVLATRVGRSDVHDPAAYLAALPDTGRELSELARALSVSETYFLRNREQFHAFAALLRQRASTPLRHLRVLSAGCSSGEEAYSLAITVRETLTDPQAWTVSIVGIDLNPDVLAKARSGAYSAWSLRDTPQAIRDTYFRRQGTHHEIADVVRRMVRFERHNLARPGSGLWRREAFDVVFCRNVLMYLERDVARAVVADIAASLVPGGHLFLGHAENLRGLSHAFALRHSHGTFYYERKGSRADAPTAQAERDAAGPDDGSWVDAIGRASRRIAELSRGAGRTAAVEVEPKSAPSARDLAPALALLEKERFGDALQWLADGPERQPEALLLRATLLVSMGDLSGAEQTCAELLDADDLDAGAHYLMAICREHAGERDRATEHARAAAYLDPDFAMPHLQLGRLARRSGDVRAARREFGVALDLLPREQSSRVVMFGGGFGREGLMQLCRGELRACGGER